MYIRSLALLTAARRSNARRDLLALMKAKGSTRLDKIENFHIEAHLGPVAGPQLL